MKVQQEYMGPRAVKDRLCILYNEMSLYPEVSQLYTPCCWDHLCYSSISVCPHQLPPATGTGSSGWDMDFPATTPSKCICTLSQLLSPGGPLTTLKCRMYIERPRYQYRPYYDLANVVTGSKTDMIDEMPCSYRTLGTSAVRICHQVSSRAVQRSQQLSKSPADLYRGLSSVKILLCFQWNLVTSWTHHHNCRCF